MVSLAIGQGPTSQQKLKRRFAKAEAKLSPTNGWQLWLDDQIWQTPAQHQGPIPTAALAKAIASEWQRLPDPFTYEDLPLTRAYGTVRDKGSAARSSLIEEWLAIAEGDGLRYRAPVTEALGTHQAQHWQPIITRLNSDFPWLDLPLIEDLTLRPLPEVTKLGLQAWLTNQDDYHLYGLVNLARLLGSVMLVLGLHQHKLTLEEAFDASKLEELWQEQFWGVDEEAKQQRWHLWLELSQLWQFYQLCVS